MSLKELIENTKGKFFTVVFTKKNGDDRVLTGRLGVTKYLKGGKKTVTQDNYLTVYDVNAKGYRTVNINTIKSLRLNNKKYIVKNGELNEV